MKPVVLKGILQAHSLRQRASARLAGAWRACLYLAQDEFPLVKVEKSIQQGRLYELYPVVEEFAENLASRYSEFVRDEYHRAMILEAVKSEEVLEVIERGIVKKAIKIEYGKFGITNPASNLAHHNNKLELIRETTKQTKKTLNSILTEGAIDGLNPNESARYIRDHIGLTDYQERIIRNYRRELQGKAPSMKAFRRKLRDRRYDKMTRRHFENQTPLSPEKVDKMTDAYRDRWVKHRAKTIARTEALRSSRQGAHDMWASMIEEGTIPPDRIRKFWITAKDGRVRHSHSQTPKLNKGGRLVNEPFVTGLGNRLLFPGEGGAPAKDTINCRCQAVYRPAEEEGEKSPAGGGLEGDSTPRIPSSGGATGTRPRIPMDTLPSPSPATETRALVPVDTPPRVRIDGFGPSGPPLNALDIPQKLLPAPMEGVPVPARRALGEVLNRADNVSRPRFNPIPIIEPSPQTSRQLDILFDASYEVMFIVSDILNSPMASMIGRKKFSNEEFEYLMDSYDTSAMLGLSAGLLLPGAYTADGEYIGEV